MAASKKPVRVQTGKGRPEPYTKAGHNGKYPEQAKKGSYRPNDPAHAKRAKV